MAQEPNGQATSGTRPQGAKLGIWNPEVENQWWLENTLPEQWFTLVDQMSLTLKEAHLKHGLGNMIQNPHWLGWMLHTRWLALFPRDWEKRTVFQTPEGREVFVKLGRTPKIRDAFLASLVPEDDEFAAITILTEIAKSHPGKISEFANLAIAYAVVFDQKLPEQWPHSFVDGNKLPVGDLDPVERFAFYVRSQESGELIHQLPKLSVEDLTFLVDSPLEFKELRYAQQIKIRSPGQLAQLYPQVPYDMSRITGKVYLWPGPTYRLIDIGTKGGICMDQAFFVAQTGKAKGVPTLLFTGQGLSGDHAWVGYLGSSGRWEMDVAKYGNQEYPIGQAYDPQTWQRITDSELQAIQSGTGYDGLFGAGHILLQWAALNEGGELYGETIRAARLKMANDPRPWQLEADWLEESGAPVAERLAFWEEWSRNYSRNPDMAVKGQMRAIALLEEAGKTLEAEKLRAAVMSGNRSKRFDLGIAIAAEPVFRKLRLRDFAGAEAAFDSAMRRFHTKAGGHLFYNLIQPYIVTCLQEGQTDLAKKAATFLQRDFQAGSGTLLDQDIQAVIERIR